MFRRSIFAALAAGAVISAAASATSLEEQEFKELVQGASACVEAEPSGTETVMIDGSPVTMTTFTVEDAVFGNVGSTITVKTPGGAISGAKVPMAEVTAGAPRFIGGVRRVLLLNDAGDGTYTVANFSQGVYDVMPSPDGGKVRLPASVGGLVAMDEAVEIISETRAADSEMIAE